MDDDHDDGVDDFVVDEFSSSMTTSPLWLVGGVDYLFLLILSSSIVNPSQQTQRSEPEMENILHEALQQ
jgi:hypothetical protein